MFRVFLSAVLLASIPISSAAEQKTGSLALRGQIITPTGEKNDAGRKLSGDYRTSTSRQGLLSYTYSHDLLSCADFCNTMTGMECDEHLFKWLPRFYPLNQTFAECGGLLPATGFGCMQGPLMVKQSDTQLPIEAHCESIIRGEFGVTRLLENTSDGHTCIIAGLGDCYTTPIYETNKPFWRPCGCRPKVT